MNLFNYILWNVSPEIFALGQLHVRWYGLLFALGFLLGQQILIRIYKQEGKSEKHVETLTIYMVIATVIGARLGHCIFYEPEYFLTKEHFIEILFVWKGGLASHGATIGILIAIYLYSRKVTDQSYFYVLDRLVITIALAGCLIRLGNLMNSEIVGKPSNSPIAFLFVHDTKSSMEEYGEAAIQNVDIKKNGKTIDYTSPFQSAEEPVKIEGIDLNVTFKKNSINSDSVNNYLSRIKEGIKGYESVRENVIFSEIPAEIKTHSNGSYTATLQAFAIPRLPSQLFEAISSFILFVVLYLIYNQKKGKTPEGRIFGLFTTILFTLRFIYEFNKENQVISEDTLIANFGLNLGQLLSIPMILIGLFILMRSFLKKNEIE
jgi:prolipoprotein diacylglyceryl transferase